MLIVERPVGPLAANCFVVASGPDATCVVIDPGQEAEDAVAESVGEHGLRPEAVLLTHGHFDHVWSAAALSERYGIPVYVHPEDAALLSDPAKGLDPALAAQLTALFGDGQLNEPENTYHLRGEQTLALAEMTFTVHHAPGHTPGSVAFSTDDDGTPTLFAGDLLFAGSIGRTDFPGGDPEAMAESLRRVCLDRPDETVVHPGHGPVTTIGRERVSNPFLRGLTS
ncbi:MBL fold metallo-hydrolase [Spiractinospora alimapuensis]|uniref:MBL fold metallo-hydrolase n=1 Tax=Spiractinospora alimapuensis TaxID=2820884 RepID=UPI001F25D9C4|nr:MBL fold metallo-hydrolase [Spiractinospora alimapuensis]QVQ52059.1 MBL fold metallo-hydrolase [Spiractinospora alimapuensis]